MLVKKMFMAIHSWNTPPHPHPLSKEGRTFQKLSHLGGWVGRVQSFLLERRDKPEKGGGVVVEMGVATFFYYFIVQSHLLCLCGAFWIFSLLSQPYKILIQVFIILKPGIICTVWQSKKMFSILFPSTFLRQVSHFY